VDKLSKESSGSNDCGLMALGYAACLLFEQDPVNVNFNQCKIRQHLLTCLEQGKLTPFPIRAYRAVRKLIINILVDELFCNCRQIYIDEVMIECVSCGQWLHPSCEGMSDKLFKKLPETNKKFICCKCMQ